MIPAPGEQPTVTVSREILASRERVFEAFSSLESLQHWFGPESCEVVSGEYDFRPGGDYRFEWRTGDGNPVLLGKILEVTPQERIRMTWAWEASQRLHGDSEVCIEFLEIAEGTRVVITHTKLPTDEMVDTHTKGWNGSLNKLTRYLTTH